MKSILPEAIETSVIQAIAPQQAWHYKILPFKITSDTFHFYSCSPNDELLKNELELILGKAIHLVHLEQEALFKHLGSYYRREAKLTSISMDNSGKVNKHFLEDLLLEAFDLKASDIHLEPFEKKCKVRFRIDGALIEKYQLNKEQYPGLCNKIKIRANLDIAEKRLPQDGRIFYKRDHCKFDIRVSSLPTLYGEKMVMRLLNNNDTSIDIKGLGFGENQLKAYQEAVQRPNGMVLISGPTGSGKTTTLYATLQLLNKQSNNILTIEDPIEYTLEGINQVQLRENIGLNFAGAMRTFLRQDPDIIMVGEIRDLDTASMAIRASLTGHLVLSTIHTNSAWGLVARLIDMGIPAYLLADTLNAAVAQRLVRLLCPDCKVKTFFNPAHLPRGFQANQKLPEHLFKKGGCPKCHYTGYKGRRAIYEIIPIDYSLATYIKNQELNIHQELKSRGFTSLGSKAFEMLIKGQTAIQDIYPILASEVY